MFKNCIDKNCFARGSAVARFFLSQNQFLVYNTSCLDFVLRKGNRRHDKCIYLFTFCTNAADLSTSAAGRANKGDRANYGRNGSVKRLSPKGSIGRVRKGINLSKLSIVVLFLTMDFCRVSSLATSEVHLRVQRHGGQGCLNRRTVARFSLMRSAKCFLRCSQCSCGC